MERVFAHSRVRLARRSSRSSRNIGDAKEATQNAEGFSHTLPAEFAVRGSSIQACCLERRFEQSSKKHKASLSWLDCNRLPLPKQHVTPTTMHRHGLDTRPGVDSGLLT
jgi:hypothetical protein